MKLQVQLMTDVSKLSCEALFVGVYQEDGLTPSAEQLDKVSGGVITEVLKEEFKASAGAVLDLRKLPGVSASRVVIVGLGKKEKFSIKTVISAHEAVSNYAKKAKLKSVVSALIEDLPEELCHKHVARQAARAVVNATYVYTESFGAENKPDLSALSEVQWLVSEKWLKGATDGVVQGEAIARGMMLTRELGNLPANICTPTYLGEKAKAMAAQYDSLSAEVLEKKQIEALKMGSFLSVAAGSDEPPRLIVLKHTPAKPSGKAPIVLVGKGVTFDTGGISLKPGAGMDEMKFDMCGAASVFGTFEAIARLGLEREVIGVVVATENMPNGHATKPGDVVTSMSGQTIEILNTDAEGRLALCDALTYAERFDPEYVVDMATLTGACVIALGGINSGLYSTDEELAQALFTAGQRTNDRAWRMPLDEEYHDLLKSNFADMQNIGGRAGGSITAACFLQKFTKKYKWAHLDIAGTAWEEGAKKGATGRPVPLLTEFLLRQK